MVMFFAGKITYAQQSEDSISFIHQDTSIHCLKDFLKKGQVHGHIRNYLMATYNQGDLKNYWTNATGGALKYETAELFGIQLGVKGIFTYKTFSTDLNDLDQNTQKGANWEKELYDINRPEEGKDLDRLEELYLKWNFSKSNITIGKMDINTGPFFLRRDGRMKPFVYQGAWAQIADLEKTKINLGWITKVSPRGMTEWYTINEAIGINNNGFEPNGHAADYHEKADSKGIGVLGLEKSIGEKIKLQYWNLFLHHITDINWLQLEFQHDHLFIGGQFVHQGALSHQQALDYQDRYIQPEEKAKVLSLKAAYKQISKGTEWSVAYLHAFIGGRFLFPRELGRENFYASQARSWIDGFGGTDVFVVQFQYTPKAKDWQAFKLDAKLSRTNTPGIGNVEFNKYNIGSHWQGTIDLKYSFLKVLEGLELHLLYITKYTANTEKFTPSEIYYRTNFHHFNGIVNIAF